MTHKPLLFVLLANIAGMGCAHRPPSAGQAQSPLELREFQPVFSEVFAAARYADGDLDLKFTDGSTQRFAPVPEPVARAFFASGGKHGYFLANIKPHYDRTILAKSYQNRDKVLQMVQVRSHWIEGDGEVARYSILEDGSVVRSSERQASPVSESRNTLSQR
jgi:hypothetical protein